MVPRKKRKRKRCRFCGRLFFSDPRLKGRQYACSARQCQRQRKKSNQECWLAQNPGYFDGRYPNTKEWLRSHLGYMKRYRLENPERVQRDNEARKGRHKRAKIVHADIQVARSLQGPVSKTLTPFLGNSKNADIQDLLLPQVILISVFSASFLLRGRADIQGSIALETPACYRRRHELDQEISAASGTGPDGSEVIQLDRPPPDP